MGVWTDFVDLIYTTLLGLSTILAGNMRAGDRSVVAECPAGTAAIDQRCAIAVDTPPLRQGSESGLVKVAIGL